MNNEGNRSRALVVPIRPGEMLTHDGARKSCPNCSRRAGRIVYLEPGSFGTRIDDKTGNELMQSWCNDCRSKAAHTEPSP